MSEWFYLVPVEKSFPGHKGRPGKKGGSLPKSADGLPPSQWDGKAERLEAFKDKGGNEFAAGKRTRINQYGSIILVQQQFGANRYARLYTSAGLRIMGPWGSQPVTGRVREVQDLAKGLAKAFDFGRAHELVGPQEAEAARITQDILGRFKV